MATISSSSAFVCQLLHKQMLPVSSNSTCLLISLVIIFSINSRTNKMLFPSALMLLLSYVVVAMAISKSDFTDQSALLAFEAQIISDPSNAITNNWSTATPFCSWFGVTCSDRHRQRVVALDLSKLQLNGTIPPQVGNLSFLQSLNLSHNNFHGHLPNELGRLHRLKQIFLHNNSLTGTIPQSIFNLTKLQLVSLTYNSLRGKILEQAVNLARLQKLAAGFNLFSGSIAPAIFNMPSLQMISVPTNNFSGNLHMNLCDDNSKLEWLDLGANQLYGQIPTDLYKCKELQTIGLNYNRFSGSIPREIGNLPKLKALYLGLNNLEGEIPREIGHLITLEVMGLEGNKLNGSIPKEIGNCTSLRRLNIERNDLTGSIPKEIKNCTLLEELILQYNQLTGVIPVEIGYLHNLHYLHLGINGFSGSFPTTVLNLSMLTSIGISSNDLSGQLPSSIGLRPPNLQTLYLGRNGLSGPIPNSICNASQLVYLDLSYNSFSGFIPNSLENLRNLRTFHIGDNLLTSKYSSPELSILSSLKNCKNLVYLALENNPLDINLPTSNVNLSTSLQYFYASNSELIGNIPRDIGNLSNLIVLSMGGNELTGTIPNSLGRLRSLQGLDLEGNKLEGSIPHELCNLESLSILYSELNKFSGSIPACLSNLTSLRQLDLSSNSFTTTIPSTLWSLEDILQLNLSSNSLTGSLPPAIGNLKVVTVLDLSRNQLSGEIPTNMGGLKDLVNLSLSNNRLQSHIPESFGDLINLEFLDLSNNSLSGVIPKSMEKLLHLVYLNVSFNHLEGEIPARGPFVNFSAQSFIGNEALCGSAQMQVPPCKHTASQSSKKHAIVSVLTYILPTIAAIMLVLAFSVVIVRYFKQKKQPPTQEELLPLAEWRRISYSELEVATDRFRESNLMGRGRFGSVYRGILSDGLTIAVKVFNLQQEGAFKSFDTECQALRNIRHRNLVKIISSCSNLDFRALVLEFMPNQSLERWLHSHYCFLDILQRLNIVIDVASALDYLHHGLNPPLVHCDLKPSNVLLNEEMAARVCDFGIAKLLGEGDHATQTTTLATIGYMAPEYGAQGTVSMKGDVYSYGILVMETFTRKQPTDEIFAGELSLRSWVKRALPDAITHVVDANLLRMEEEQHYAAKKECILSVLEVASECSADLPEDRIDMGDVLVALQKIKTKFLNDLGNT